MIKSTEDGNGNDAKESQVEDDDDKDKNDDDDDDDDDDDMTSGNDSEDKIPEKVKFNLKKLVRLLHVAKPVDLVMGLIGKK